MEHTHYFCHKCKSIFEAEELKVVKENPYSPNAVGMDDVYCPHCNSNILNLSPCSPCQIDGCENLIENNNKDGVVDSGYAICKDCLFKLVDYNVGYEYIKHNNDLPMFVFEYIFDVEEPKAVNTLLMNEIEMMFQRKKVEDFLYSKPLLLNKIKEYIENDLWAFSDYLKEKGVI